MAGKKKAKAGKRGGGFAFLVIGLALFAMLLFATPAFIVLMVGLVPAFVALVVDADRARYATIAVFATNLAGVVPFVLELVIDRASMMDAVAMVSDVFIIAVMYGAAAIGWALVLGMPKVAAVYISVVNQSRIESMRKEQQRLVEEWGSGVAHGG